MQALSRSHRIGQDKKVIVYRFISSETIEEKIRHLQESKSRLASTFVRSGNPLADLSREELDRLMNSMHDKTALSTKISRFWQFCLFIAKFVIHLPSYYVIW
jgi:hypothetical protein